jgi:hypothetical protein
VRGRGRRRRLTTAWTVAAMGIACAGAPAPPSADRATAWGYVRLQPREGLAAPGAGAASYGDRRLADVALVDYERPGFAVVYAEAGPARPAGPVRLAVRPGRLGPRLEPAHAALGAGGTLEVANETADMRMVSCPAAGLVRRLAPGETLAIPAPTPGEWPVYLLDAPGEPARVFAAPGPFAVTSDAGRFELADLPPGRHRILSWHPRFPPAAATVELVAGRAERVDLELRVGATDEDGNAR